MDRHEAVGAELNERLGRLLFAYSCWIPGGDY